jgi:hypothetical protein
MSNATLPSSPPLQRSLRVDTGASRRKIEELIEDGMSHDEAARAARLDFGNVTLLEERRGEVWQWSTFELLKTDIKYSFRQISKSAGFAVAVILTIALSIGATTSIFTLVDATLLRSLFYPEADRIIHIKDERQQGQSTGGLVSMPLFFDLRARAQSLEAIAFFMFDRKT